MFQPTLFLGDSMRIPALSIRQPWAWLIVNGHKDVENRTWATSFRGPLLIHAGKTPPDWTAVDYETCAEEYGVVVPRDGLQLGGIVGAARMSDCVDKSDSQWFAGPWGFVMREQRELPFVPLRGRLGFFNVDPKALPSVVSRLFTDPYVKHFNEGNHG